MTNLILSAQDLASRQTEFIGCLSQWKLKFEHSMPQAVVEEEATKLGLNLHWMSKPSLKQGIARACKKLAKEKSNKDVEFNADKTVDDKEFYGYCIYGKVKDKQNKQFNFYHSNDTKIWLVKATNELKAEGQFTDEAMAFSHMFSDIYTSDDIRLFCRGQMLDACGVMYHEGVYVIPNNQKCVDKITALDTFLRNTGFAGSFFYNDGNVIREEVVGVITFAIPNGKEAVFVASALYDDLNKRLEDIKEKTGKISTRKSAIENQKEDLIELQVVLDTYEKLVQDKYYIDQIKLKFEEVVKVLDAKTAQLSN
jgi:hypothetical protein